MERVSFRPGKEGIRPKSGESNYRPVFMSDHVRPSGYEKVRERGLKQGYQASYGGGNVDEE